MRAPLSALAALALFGAGCGDGGGSQPAFPELHPVTGTVKRDGAPVKGGAVAFAPDPAKPDFLINSEVGPDGTFELSTVRTTDRSGERKTGAPAGTYKVTFTPPLGDQTAGGAINPIAVPKPVAVAAGPNTLTIDLPKK
jgi:hypothetical protein